MKVVDEGNGRYNLIGMAVYAASLGGVPAENDQVVTTIAFVHKVGDGASTPLLSLLKISVASLPATLKLVGSVCCCIISCASYACHHPQTPKLIMINKDFIIDESSEGLSSTTISNPRGIAPIACSGTPNLYKV